MLRIGYACLTVGVPDTALRTCTQKNATPELLRRLIDHNLAALDRMLDYNLRSGIRLFRISSDIIPFGSSPVNTVDWQAEFAPRLRALGQKAVEGGMRLSMHPGQYTVLNSPDPGVVERAATDLRYHGDFLGAMGLGREHKLILHIGGVYGDKDAAMERFCSAYRGLDEAVRARLVVENDDRSYTAAEVLAIAKAEGIPAVFDNLHHQVNPGAGGGEMEWVAAFRSTWRPGDGPQKLHYSQQAPDKRPGSHSAGIAAAALVDFVDRLPSRELDVMLEVKDKNLSAVKGVLCVGEPGHIRRLEQEWARYKYAVLERAPDLYNRIRALLKDKGGYPALEFYALVEEALAREGAPGHAVNAAQHVWGYCRDAATPAERRRAEKLLAEVGQGGSAAALKRHLWRLAEKYRRDYLLDSLYFVL